MKGIRSLFPRISAYTMGMSASVLLFPFRVVAAAAWLPSEGPSQDSLDELIRVGLNTAIIFAAVVSVVFLIYNGFNYMSAGGDATKIEKAQKGLANALIGLVIAIAAAIIVNFVLGLFGMEAQNVD